MVSVDRDLVDGDAYVSVSIKCETDPPFTLERTFRLSRMFFKALGQLHSYVSAPLILFDIDPSKCVRRVRISLPSKPKPAFAILVKALKDAGVEVEVLGLRR